MSKQIFLLLALVTTFFNFSSAQGFEEEFYITDIKIEKEKVMLNKVYAFKFLNETNGYTIADKNGKEEIHAATKVIDQTRTITTFTFVNLQDKKFTNSMINTPEQLFRMFSDNNVIDKDFKINYVQLKGILEKLDGK